MVGDMAEVAFETIPLRKGAHQTRDHGVCAMELVAWMAGEPHAKIWGACLTSADLSGADLSCAHGILAVGPCDGWMMYAVRHPDGPRIKAGCRWFTVPEAREHWSNPDRAAHNALMLAGVDALLALAKAHGWETRCAASREGEPRDRGAPTRDHARGALQGDEAARDRVGEGQRECAAGAAAGAGAVTRASWGHPSRRRPAVNGAEVARLLPGLVGLALIAWLVGSCVVEGMR
jgi:hypothetical protein